MCGQSKGSAAEHAVNVRQTSFGTFPPKIEVQSRQTKRRTINGGMQSAPWTGATVHQTRVTVSTGCDSTPSPAAITEGGGDRSTTHG